jgi:hypothetical protein
MAWDNSSEENKNEWKEGDDGEAGGSVQLKVAIDPVRIRV